MSIINRVFHGMRDQISWSSQAQRLVERRYLPHKDMTIPQWIQSIAEKAGKGIKEQKSYFSLMHGRYFFPTSAALHNILSDQGSLAGCIVYPLQSQPELVIERDVPRISRLLMKGIGVGLDLSQLPPRLHPDARSGRAYPGPVEILQSIAGATSALADYEGLKRAAFMGALLATHPDATAFIGFKKTQPLPCANVSIAIDSTFKSALTDGRLLPFSYRIHGEQKFLTVQTWLSMQKEALHRGLASHDLQMTVNGDVKSVSLDRIIGSVNSGLLCLDPRKIIQAIAQSAHECGDPGLLDLETINHANPTHPRFSNEEGVLGQGKICVTTPCGEQPLLPYEVCHLGSFNLHAFVQRREFDFDLFKEAIPVAVQLMDDLVERSDNGLDEANAISKSNRKIGMGVMGLADVFAETEVPYASDEAFALAHRIGGTLQKEALKASQQLALVRGAFKTFHVSKANFWGRPFQRHATLTTIAPTGHISTLAGCSSAIEPYYLLEYERLAAGVSVVKNPILAQKLEQLNWSLQDWIAATCKQNPNYQFDGTLRHLITTPFDDAEKNARLLRLQQVFQTAGEISPENHLKMVAVFQKHVDNGVSKTINLPFDATQEMVEQVFLRAIAFGLKGITVYRNLSQQTQALSSPKECATCTSGSDGVCMKEGMQYTHLLKCLDYRGHIKYELPAILVDTKTDYWIYSRPDPVVHHRKKGRSFLLEYPEILLVSKQGNHCISIAFDGDRAVNMYVNINTRPEPYDRGHQWKDLELDIKLTKDVCGIWHPVIVDEDEFEAADLTDGERIIAQEELSVLLTKIQLQQFPFCDDLSEVKKCLKEYHR